MYALNIANVIEIVDEKANIEANSNIEANANIGTVDCENVFTCGRELGIKHSSFFCICGLGFSSFLGFSAAVVVNMLSKIVLTAMSGCALGIFLFSSKVEIEKKYNWAKNNCVNGNHDPVAVISNQPKEVADVASNDYNLDDDAIDIEPESSLPMMSNIVIAQVHNDATSDITRI